MLKEQTLGMKPPIQTSAPAAPELWPVTSPSLGLAREIGMAVPARRSGWDVRPRVVSSEPVGSGGCGGSKAVGLPCAWRPSRACGHRRGPLTHHMPRAFLESSAGADVTRGPKQQLPASCPSLPGGDSSVTLCPSS